MEKRMAGGRESRSVMEAYNMMYLPHATLEEAELSKYKTPETPTSDWKGEFAFERHFKYPGKQKHQ
jgi:hypothetical protein